MLVPGDLGFFQVAVFFVFVVFPAGFFVVRRKWRIAVTRRAEIKRLLVLASEEAARAEIEASVGYSHSSASVAPSIRHCAVCFAPTHNRCARCKSVHYCCGKCQIIHWRQGHKDECRLLVTSFENNEESINFVENSVKQPNPDNCIASVENDIIPLAKQDNTASEESGSPLESFAKDDSETVDSGHAKESDSLSEVDESSSCEGICIDDSTDDGSLRDSSSSSHESCSTFDYLETFSSDKRMEQSNLLREESDAKVEAGGNISASGGATKVTTDIGNASPDLRISSENHSKGSTLSTSDFWNGSLESSITRKYAHTNNVKEPIKSDRLEFSDSKITAEDSKFLGDLSSESPLQGSGASRSTNPDTSGARKLIGSTSPEKESTDIARQRSSTNLSSERADVRVISTKGDGNLVRFREVRHAYETPKDKVLPLSVLNAANNLEKENKDNLLSPLSKKDGLSTKASTDLGPSPSGTSGLTTPTVKSAKASCESAMAPQVTTHMPSASVGLKTSVLKVVEQLRAPKSSKQSEVIGRDNEKGVFPYDLFVKLYHWKKVELRPCGLINCGNSCYANAVLQCLAFTPPLTAFLLQGLHSKACADKGWCFSCEFERLILKAKEGSSPQSPIGILSQIQKIGSHLASGREEDAHEFLRYAIDTMQSACLQEAGASASSPLEEETTLMGLTFGGYLRSKIKCTRCHGKSERQERMMDLTVEIEGDIDTLEDALRQFTRTESLDGDNKYHCGRCKSYEKAKKKLSISEAPNVLTIALKRFQSGKFGKLNKSIRFPEILNLAPFMRGSSDDKSPIYRLYGVVVHLDIMNASFSGHYVCYVRNGHNKWYKIDDSMVKAVEIERVLNKGAYMLFYSRCSPRAPRSIRNSTISRGMSAKTKNLDVNPSRTTGKSTTLRNNPSYVHQEGPRPTPATIEIDSSSDNSSLFSNSDENSSSIDSIRDSISTDDFSDDAFRDYSDGFWRNSLDPDTSSSSSSSSSPLYTNHSSLSNPERNVYTQPQPAISKPNPCSHSHSVPVWDPSWAYKPRETSKTEEPGPAVGAPFLQSNSSSSSSKQVRNLVNSSSISSGSCRGADSERLRWTNSSDSVNSGVHLRRSLRKKADETFHHTVIS